MKKLTLSVLIPVMGIISASAQCTCNYSYSGTNETLTFTNLSSVSNAHYYWNFGDGSGSNDVNPIHNFPDDGKYLVTLYGLDTISNCSNFHQEWISVIKPDTFTCNVLFDDTIIGNSLQTFNLSTNCSGLGLNCHVMGPGQNYCGPDLLDPAWGPSLFLHGMKAYTYDSVNGYGILKEYYKTVPYQFDYNVNYQNCSPNFEITIDYQQSGALVTMTAMNKSGNSTFWITGFGNGIPLSGPTVSYLYPYISYARNFPWIIQYVNGCGVKGTQQILINNPYYVLPPNCSFSSIPQGITANIGSTVQFTIESSPLVFKQWQQDAGLGFVNLSNAGPYSGVNTDTLSISNVQYTMNNYHYRCILSDSAGGCHNTGSYAVLNVNPVGIFDDISEGNLEIFPNPFSESATLRIKNSQKMKAQLTIYNLLGEEVYQSTINNQQLTIQRNTLPSGIYIYKVFSSEKMIGAGKLVKE